MLLLLHFPVSTLPVPLTFVALHLLLAQGEVILYVGSLAAAAAHIAKDESKARCVNAAKQGAQEAGMG